MAIFYLLTFLVCGAYVLLMILYWYGWQKTFFVFKPSTINHQPSTIISVIIPARNEEENILKILDCLYKQTYPLSNFEIIVVDDHSSDRTAEFIYQLDIPNLKLIQLSPNKVTESVFHRTEKQYGKKAAITEGIKNSNGKLIITTDADCEMGEEWISSIVSFYEKEKPKMIVAPVLLKNEKGFLETMQSQEMTALTASACGSLYYNLPILCSGANLAYEKEAFISVNGFDGADKTLTGDDVFLMLKIHKKYPKQIKYLKSNEAVVFTHAEKNIVSVLAQRKRWASKTFLYGFSHVTGIAVLIFLANFFIFLLVPIAIGISVINPVGIISNGINIKFAFALIVTLSLKCIVDYMLIYSASSFFGPTKSTDSPTKGTESVFHRTVLHRRKRIHPFEFLVASILYPVYVSLLGLISPFTNYSWKGRKS